MDKRRSAVLQAIYLAARSLHGVGIPGALRKLWGGRRITVLAYHRIADVYAPDFRYLEDNVSASPAMFVQQMEYVRRHFNVIDLQTLVQAVVDSRELPEKSLLITFDDGYYDNYLYAYPVLKRLGLPAVFFLTTGHMEASAVPWWDMVSYCFHTTTKQHVDLPMLGKQNLSTMSRRTLIRNAVLERMKHIPEDEKRQVLPALSRAMEVTPPDQHSGLFMNWDHARELSAHGMTCQPHTVTHPILTRIDSTRMRRELTRSFDDIREQIGENAIAFAYPNGKLSDYNADTIETLRELGCKVAFTIHQRLSDPAELRKFPFEIPRLYIGYRDSIDIFALKVNGFFAVTPTIIRDWRLESAHGVPISNL